MGLAIYRLHKVSKDAQVTRSASSGASTESTTKRRHRVKKTRTVTDVATGKETQEEYSEEVTASSLDEDVEVVFEPITLPDTVQKRISYEGFTKVDVDPDGTVHVFLKDGPEASLKFPTTEELEKASKQLASDPTAPTSSLEPSPTYLNQLTANRPTKEKVNRIREKTKASATKKDDKSNTNITNTIGTDTKTEDPSNVVNPPKNESGVSGDVAKTKEQQEVEDQKAKEEEEKKKEKPKETEEEEKERKKKEEEAVIKAKEEEEKNIKKLKDREELLEWTLNNADKLVEKDKKMTPEQFKEEVNKRLAEIQNMVVGVKEMAETKFYNDLKEKKQEIDDKDGW